jgi:hypothetical protein
VAIGFNYNSSAQPISPILTGNNAWQELNGDVWKGVKECGLQCIRIGGEGYDGGLPGATGEWVRIINEMGAEPIIQIPQNASPENAAGIVKQYPDNIYYNIGNEPDLALFGAVSVDVVAGYVKSKASAMKKVNPKIKIYAPDCCYYNEGYYSKLFSGNGDNLDVSGKDANGNYYVDGLCWHKYPYDAGGAQHGQVNTRFVNAMRESIIAGYEQISIANKKHNRTGADALGWGIGEFNAVDGNDAWTFENGQMHAGVCGITMQYEGTYACSWSLWENGGSHGETGFSFFEPGLVPRSSNRHMSLIAKHFSGFFLNPADTTKGTPATGDIMAFGCKDSSKKKYCAMIMNRGTTSYTYTVRFDKAPITEGAIKLNFDADCNGEYQDQIPGLTTILVYFTPDKCKRYFYTAANHLKAPDSTDIKFKSGGITAAVRDQGFKTNSAEAGNFRWNQNGKDIAITFQHAQEYKIELVNANGRVVARYQGSGAVAHIANDKLSKGLCLVRVTTTKGTIAKRFLLM